MGLVSTSRAPLYRLATGAALIGAPLLFLIANILHPEEFSADHEREQLAAIAEDYTTWQVAHFLTFASVIVFATAVLGLAYLVRRRRPGIGLWAGAIGIAGLFGLAFVDALDGYAWAILGEVSTRPEADGATLELALHDMQQSSWSIPYYMTPLLFIIGVATLALTAARTRAVPLPAAVVFTLGVVLAGLEAEIQDNAYFVAASSVLFLGGAAMGAAVLRMTDEEFAQPAAGAGTLN